MHRKAVNHLRRVDPRLATVMKHVGPCRLVVAADGTHFDAVVRSIIYQQVSTSAAATIHGRIIAGFGGRSPLPSELLAASDEQLRSWGVSRQKARYLRDLAAAALDGRLPIESLHELSDVEIESSLTSVKGVGRWTAQMFLIFRLGRPDILPELDLGVRKAIMRVYRLRRMPSAERVHEIGAPWAPYRSIASWYLWRSLALPVAVVAPPRLRAARGR